MAVGGEEEWNFVWDEYSRSNDPYEKRLFLRSLAESTEPWILSRFMIQCMYSHAYQIVLYVLCACAL